jgi:beta-phosphoglucomutase-like phosphatase (HAD superfamily)
MSGAHDATTTTDATVVPVLLHGHSCAAATGGDVDFKPSALIFDCDGTVLDTMEWYYPSWEAVCHPYGIKFSRKKFYSLAGVPVKEIFDIILKEQDIRAVTSEQLVREKRAVVAEQRKVSVPGCIECVCDIVRANYGKVKMAIASSGHKQHVIDGLRENNMLEYFDVVVTHEDVCSGKNKPEPDIFLLAAKELNVDPKECRGFEDADVGMTALVAAGMDACDVRKMTAYPHHF